MIGAHEDWQEAASQTALSILEAAKTTRDGVTVYDWGKVMSQLDSVLDGSKKAVYIHLHAGRYLDWLYGNITKTGLHFGKPTRIER